MDSTHTWLFWSLSWINSVFHLFSEFLENVDVSLSKIEVFFNKIFIVLLASPVSRSKIRAKAPYRFYHKKWIIEKFSKLIKLKEMIILENRLNILIRLVGRFCRFVINFHKLINSNSKFWVRRKWIQNRTVFNELSSHIKELLIARKLLSRT